MNLRLLALAWFAAAGAMTPPTGRWMQANDSLVPGVSLERELKDGESHRYELKLPANQYIHIRAIEKGVGLSLEIRTEAETLIAKADRPNVYFGPKSVHAIVLAGGVYRVVCQSNDNDSKPGRYSILLAESRPATERDARLFASQAFFSEALNVLGGARPEHKEQAIRILLEALEALHDAGDRELRALVLTHLGLVTYDLQRYVEAESWYTQAIAEWRSLEDRQGEARALNNLGAIYSRQGEPRKAGTLYEQALARWRESGDLNGQARATFNLGAMRHQLNERQQALDLYDAAIRLYRQGGYFPAIPGVENSIGLLYFELGETQQALDYYARVLAYYRAAAAKRPASNQPAPLSRVLNDLGEVYAWMGDEERALAHFNQALAIREETGDRYEAAMTLANLGLLHAAAGRADQAREAYERALAYARATTYRALEAATLGHLGELVAAAEPAKARELYQTALTLNRTLSRKDAEALTLYRIARLELSQDRLNEARADIESAIDLSEDSRAMIASQELRSSFFATKQDYFEFYIDLLMRMHGQNPEAGYDRLAMQASERSRARSLIELLAATHVRLEKNIDSALAAQAAQLRERTVQQTNRHFSLLRNRVAQKPEIAEVETLIRSLNAEYEQALAKMRGSNPDFAALTRPQPLDPVQVQAQLDRDTVLLQYSLGKERSYLWMVSRDSIQSCELPPRERIDAAALQLYEFLIAYQPHPGDQQNPKQRFEREQNADRQYWPSAARLASILLDPLADRLADKLPGKRLVIVPDGALHYVPFNVLPVPRQIEAILRGGLKGAQPVPLIVEHEIVYLPSISALSLQRKEPGAAGYASRRIALFADPVFSPGSRAENQKTATGAARGYQRDGLSLFWLKHSAREAANIAALSARRSSFFALGFDANRDAVLRAELKRYPIVHFSTHALFNNRNPSLSGIVLSLYDRNGSQRDGFLPLHDIFNLDLAADVVVLSACQTALGREIRGEGMIGLTRGFLHGGAKRVVSSLWMVDDSATCDLMTHFYEAMWKKKTPPAAALRDAQIRMWRQLSEHRSRQSPYFWGGFILQGDWR